MLNILSKIIEKNKNNKLGILYALILLIILSLFAGFRSIDMGWDARKYVVSSFHRLTYYKGSFKNSMNTNIEFGFALYSYLLYIIYPNINFLLFGFSFITTLFVILFVFKEKNNYSISKILILYYLTLYLISFNIIRQSIGVSISLLSLSYFKRKNIKMSILLLIISCLFHTSGLFTIPIYILYKFINKKESFTYKKLKCIFIIFLVFIFGIEYEKITLIFYNIGILPSKYYQYILSYNRLDYNLSNIIINLFWVLFGIILLKHCINYKKKNDLMFNVFILNISLIINIVSIKLHPIYRISYYYYYLGLLNFYPMIDDFFKKKSINMKLKNAIVYSVLLIWFLWITILGNGHNIYPYYSDIIK